MLNKDTCLFKTVGLGGVFSPTAENDIKDLLNKKTWKILLASISILGSFTYECSLVTALSIKCPKCVNLLQIDNHLLLI